MKNPQGLQTSVYTLICTLAGLASIAAPPLRAQAAPAPEPATSNEKVTPDVLRSNDETIVMSPFEVTTDTKGYYAPNTMSGTRMNSKIEDLASAITVVTKEQMSDFAMLDINDIFLYTAGTEGTGTYTAYTIDRNGSVSDAVQLNPTQANRVRGIAPANISYGNVQMLGRMPVDPSIIDGAEVSRGPNANVFGLGNPSGTVNQIPIGANLSRNRAQVATRVDSYEGYRGSIDVNRVLVKGKLAVRGTAVFNHEAFERKPSGVDTERYNAMIKFSPFKTTTISASALYWHSYGTRPNFSPPRDNISYWIQSGRPTWDPVAQVIHLNGQTIDRNGVVLSGATVLPITNNNNLPNYFTQTFTGSTRSYLFTDQSGIGYWTVPQTTPITSPITANLGNATSGTIRFLATTPAANSAAGKITNQPLFATTPSVRDKWMYDWTKTNYASVNWQMDKELLANIQLDQIVLNTERHMLAVNLGFMREDAQRYARNIMGTANDNGQSGQLFVDINEKLLDGSPNPYFLRPYFGIDQPRTVWQPAKWDTYRGQFAYRLDLTHEKNWMKWLGMHQLTGYDEYDYRIQRAFSYRDAMVDAHPWLPAGTVRGNQGAVTGGPAAAPNLTRGYFRYYVGDANGSNIDYAPSPFSYGSYQFVWGGQNGVFNRENAVLGQVPVTDAAGAGSNTKTVLKTVGAVLQSHFLNDSVVTTFGKRQDKVYTKFGGTQQLTADRMDYDYVAMNSWATGDYRYNSGRTDSQQYVVRPFKDLPFARRLQQSSGAAHFFGNLLTGMSLSFNRSNSFLPQAPAQDLFQNALPNTTGTDREYGLSLNLLDGKLVLTARRYETKQLNARNGDANTIATRSARIDIGQTDPFNFVPTATQWVQVSHPDWSTTQVQDEVARVTGLSTAKQQFLQNPVPGLAATNDVTAKGTELEVNFNPTRAWTVSANAYEQRVINTNVTSAIADWIAQRMPFWTTAVDTRTNTLWWNTGYGANNVTPASNYASFVQAPYSIIQQQQGKANPQIRRYNFRLSTNYRLSGLTENRILRNFNVGGSIRWEDKAAIGYYGVEQLPATITRLDSNRPIYDKARTYVDLLVGYRTRMFRNRIPVTFQLNVRNLQTNGELQPVAAYPDGTPSTYRIIDPRIFILQATFDL